MKTANAIRSASAAAFDPLREKTDDDRSPRREMVHESYVLRSGGQKLGVELLDFSADGCCVGAPSYLWAGEELKLYLPWRGAVDASVRWCRDGKAGLAFADLPDERTERIERAAPRIGTSADVTLRRVGKSRFKVAVLDLSPRGCRVEIVERPQVGEAVQVKFDRLDTLDGTVRWVDGHEAGVKFDRPIHPAVFEMLAARLMD
jgi:hypothetical protein